MPLPKEIQAYDIITEIEIAALQKARAVLPAASHDEVVAYAERLLEESLKGGG